MSDAVWISIIGGIVTLLLALMNLRLGKIAKTTEAVHILTNSNMAVQLKLTAVAMRRLAILTNSPVDVEAAALADKALKAHDASQAVVDSKDFPLG